MQHYVPEPLDQEGVKHIDCPFYVECLTCAVNRKWDSWSCGACPNHLLVPIFKRLEFVEQYYPNLAEIYPEFRQKFERFIKFYQAVGA